MRHCHSDLRVWVAPLVLGIAFCGAGCGVVAKQQNAAGVQMYQQGAYEAAIQKFQQSIATSPKSADGYYNLAATYHGRGVAQNRPEDLLQAESFYNQCLDRDANHQDCYRGLAVLLTRQGHNDKAKRLLEGWASRSPALSAPKVELARLSEELGDKTKAKQYLHEALAANPYDPRALAALGAQYEGEGNPAQAIQTYQRSLWQNKYQPELAARLAKLQSAVSPTPLVSTPATGAPTATVGASAPVRR